MNSRWICSHIKEEDLDKYIEKVKMDKKYGCSVICDERKRQIEVEGYDKDHDSKESIESLVNAAICYAILGLKENHTEEDLNYVKELWTWDPIYLKPKDRERNLVRAGALIAAALDKLYDK